jgi:hypothetical protein
MLLQTLPNILEGKGRDTMKLSEHFDSDEGFACHCPCHILNLDPKVIPMLEAVRYLLNLYYPGTVIVIESACRCSAHNIKPVKEGGAGGEKNSQHITTKKRTCKAVDLKAKYQKNGVPTWIKAMEIKKLTMEIISHNLPGLSDWMKPIFAIHGIGLYAASPNMIHLDVRPGKLAEWRR